MNNSLRLILFSIALMFIGCSAGEGTKATKNNERKPAESDGSTAMGVLWENIPQIKSVAFSGADRAWLVTERDGELWRTQDGGNNWTKLSGDVIGGWFMVVSFIDSQRGWAASYEGQVWRTFDGGQSWTFLSRPRGGKHNDNEPFFLPEQMLFVDESHGWLIDAFAVWRTEDGGASWEVSLTGDDAPEVVSWQPTEILFLNPNVGWVSSTGGTVHSTKDGGKTWRSKSIGEDSMIESVSFVDERSGWLCSGEIYRSDDGGASWKQQSVSVEGLKNAGISGVQFLSESEGWAVGRDWAESPGRYRRAFIHANDYKGAVIHTTDNGQTWEGVDVGENEPFFDRVHFVDSQTGWLFSRDNVYRTQDGGRTWDTVLKFQPIKNSECPT